MQMLKFKILFSSLILFMLYSTVGIAQSPEKELVKADSLYQKKQYPSIFKRGDGFHQLLIKIILLPASGICRFSELPLLLPVL